MTNGMLKHLPPATLNVNRNSCTGLLQQNTGLYLAGLLPLTTTSTAIQDNTSV